MSTVLCLILLVDPLPITRISYQLEMIEGNRRLVARMVLNQLDENQYSIHCRKVPSGSLFTYWATPDKNTLYFIKSSQAFVGEAALAFRLFPKGPALRREDWRMLLSEQAPTIEGYLFAVEAGWRILRNRESGITIRWREKKRVIKTSYSARVLQPDLPQGTQVKALAEMATYWVPP